MKNRTDIKIEAKKIDNPNLADGTTGNVERYIFSKSALGIGLQIDYDDELYCIYNHQFTSFYKIEFIDKRQSNEQSFFQLEYEIINHMMQFASFKLDSYKMFKNNEETLKSYGIH